MCEIEEKLTRNLYVFHNDYLFDRNMVINANDWNNGEGVDIEISMMEKQDGSTFINKRVNYMEFTNSELEILSKVINKILLEEG